VKLCTPCTCVILQEKFYKGFCSFFIFLEVDNMQEYAIISGSAVIGVIRAENIRKAAKKATERIADEYKNMHNVKLLKVSGADRN